MSTTMPAATAATGRGHDRTAPMQLAIRQMPSPNRPDGHTHLIQWQGTPAEVRTVAEAWATVCGYDKVLRIFAEVFDGPPPASGWRITLRKPAALMLDLPLALVTGAALARRLAVGAATQDTRTPTAEDAAKLWSWRPRPS